jgi:DNA-binding MarR family transcriptional regulator
MEIISSERGNVKGRRGPLTAAIKASLNDLGVELSLLSHRVGAHLDLRGVDIDCLSLIFRHGPLSPSALARRTRLHPATLTGILDRLERGGWVARERDPSDRRAVVVRALRDRNTELFRLLAGMNTSMNDILRQYSAEELEVVADFLRRTADAGQNATSELATRPSRDSGL